MVYLYLYFNGNIYLDYIVVISLSKYENKIIN